MAHVELYKKYRPSTWKEIVGQSAVVSSLRHAVTSGSVPTAYGFFGSHGCGKTSTAKVLAKALNCVSVSDSGQPCNVCESCVSIDAGTSLDVTYISMANDGSADNVRELCRKAMLQPHGKKSVMILDEFHNLSKAAFDAMLIPLESSSCPSLFILCSTEPEKIPKTVLSRTQVYNFRPIERADMEKFVDSVVEREDVRSRFDHTTQSEVIRRAKGSARDVLTLMEQVLTSGGLDAYTGNESALAKKVMKAVFYSSSDSEAFARFLQVCDETRKESNFSALANALFLLARKTIISTQEKGKDVVGSRPDAFALLRDVMIACGTIADMCARGDGTGEQIIFETHMGAVLSRHTMESQTSRDPWS